MGEVYDLLHGGMRKELMRGVVGKGNTLIHCGSVGRVDDLAQRQRGVSVRGNTRQRWERLDADTLQQRWEG